MNVLDEHIHETKKRPIKILQFGEGNFLRAFIDWFIQEINEQTDFNGNIAVVQPLAFGRVEELAKQNGLYTLLLEGIEQNKEIHQQQIINVLEDFINPYTDFNHYLSYAKSKDLQFIISNTTEAGIFYNPIDLDDEQNSISYPGRLLSFLKKRFEYFHGDYEYGLFILPCELINSNGDTLKNCMLQLAKDRKYSNDFIEWLLHANKYYNTLVDRIVPGYPKEQIKELEAKNGYIDINIVKGEIFHLWVIEGDPIIKQFLPIDKTKLHIIVTDNVKPYKERKVKILNGSHTCMLPIAYQLGFRYVNSMINDPKMIHWLTMFLKKEVWPTIQLSQQELEQFTSDVIDRFSNPSIHHELLTISLNSMTKYKTRVLPSAISIYQITNELPIHALFSLSSLFSMYRLSAEDGTSLIHDDPLFIDMWKTMWMKNDIDMIVEHVMSLPHWEYDFHEMKGSIAYVTQCLKDINTFGMADTFHKYFE